MPRKPHSTYRLQLHENFKFCDASAIAPYLSALGVSHVYSSPYLQAAPGSMHGYDVVDHSHVNTELGGIEAHTAFCKTLGEHGLGQVLDIVPNHMAIGQQNRFWWDVLENGASSRYAAFFDIDWQPQEERLRDKVLVPVLADQYGVVLAAGDIRVVRSQSTFEVEAASQRLPVGPHSLPVILARAADYAHSDILSFISASFARLPIPEPSDRLGILARHRDKTVLNLLLARLCSEDNEVCLAIDRSVVDLNANHDALDDFLNRQNYRLAFWKTADQQLGYRRFFDVNSLIGLRMERGFVFEETHALLVQWIREGVLDGLRIDHPDGLRDPAQYFGRLRAAAPDAWIVGEKILEPGEFLRESWPIAGTSGYDFLNVALGLLVSPAGMQRLTAIYAEYTGEPTDFAVIAHDKKLAVTQEALGTDVNRLATLFVEICEQHRDHRDATSADIRRAIAELAACFSVYRTYVVPEHTDANGTVPAEITGEDRAVLKRAVQCARDNRPEIESSLFEFLEQVLTLEVVGRLETEFVLRFQQFSSPVMAKGVEDTAFYCFNRLTALCEVGGDPARDGYSVEEFHAYNRKIQATHPRTMTTLSTHDTKRADDVRARLAVLSEIPDLFDAALKRWTANNARYKTGSLPDANTEYFLYQTLIGAWPIDADRTRQYMQKAMREAKQRTSWVANNKEYEDALNAFIDAILDDPRFTADLVAFVASINTSGRINSLTQTLLKLTAPGIPDLYQGSELWDHSLVDPDNRRPVDYGLRAKLLKELPGLGVEGIMARMEEGLPKLALIHAVLHLRKQHPEWFGPEADYIPLPLADSSAGHAIAFQRGQNLITVVPLHPQTLAGNWQDCSLTLPAGSWRNLLTGDTHPAASTSLSRLLAQFPVALLIRETSDPEAGEGQKSQTLKPSQEDHA